MIVVTGATGNLGRAVVAGLHERVDAAGVRGLTHGDADFASPDALVRAFDGADRLLIISLGLVRDRFRLHANAVEAAVKAGVGHVVYTSLVRAGEPGNPVALAADHAATEELLAASGVPHTVLRFNQWPEMLLLTGIAPGAVAAGVLPSNAGEGRTGYLARDDAAATAAALLAGPVPEERILEVTGPAALSDADLAEALTAATGRRVVHRAESDENAAAALLALGMAAPMAHGWAASGPARREGWFDRATPVAERLTGRPPTSLEDYLRRALSPTGA